MHLAGYLRYDKHKNATTETSGGESPPVDIEEKVKTISFGGLNNFCFVLSTGQ